MLVVSFDFFSYIQNYRYKKSSPAGLILEFEMSVHQKSTNPTQRYREAVYMYEQWNIPFCIRNLTL